MAIRFEDIGNRLKAFRLGSKLTADEIASRVGISRAALYRYERGEVTKLETLERMAALLGVSVPTLLGVGVEYVPSAIAFFERMRQIEAECERIFVLFGPVSYLLTSDEFDRCLARVLKESVPDGLPDRDAELASIDRLMVVLAERKQAFAERRPGVVSLIASSEMERFLRNGLVGRTDLDPAEVAERRRMAAAEAERIAVLMDEQPIGIQIGVVVDTVPSTNFQIFRQPDRSILAISPFRLGEQPNVRIGVAAITSAPEALALHEQVVDDLWQRALKGSEAAAFLRGLIRRYGVEA